MTADPDWYTRGVANGTITDACLPRPALAKMPATPEPLTLVLPWPLSANHSKVPIQRDGKVFMVSAKATRQYYKDVWAVVCTAAQIGQAWGFARCFRLAVTLEVFPPTKGRFDICNAEKLVVDALVKAGVLADDSNIDEMHLFRRSVFAGGKVVVTIRVRE
jgi:crossover junction endodeoxyribonuclease RusA